MDRVNFQHVILKFPQCSFFLKSKKPQKSLAIFIVGMIACILWLTRFQIGNGDRVGSLLMILSFVFMVEGASGLLRYISVKF